MYSLAYIVGGKVIISKKVNAVFYKTERGNEPVRETLKKLGRPIKTIVGEDIRFIELQLKLSKPEAAKLWAAKSPNEASIYEARHKVDGEQYRTLFFINENQMILVHFFHKKTQKVAKKEIEVAKNRMKQWMKKEKEA